MSRTQATPIVGVDAQFILTPIGGGSDIILWNSDWDITLSNAIAECPNTSDGMVRAPGLNDYKGSVKGKTNVGSASTPVEVNAAPGNFFAFKAYRTKGGSLYWSGTLIIGEDLKISTGTGTAEEWEFSFAKAYGNLIAPGGGTF